MNTNVTALVSQEGLAENRASMAHSYPTGYGEQGLFDLSAIRAILWRQRWILLAVTGATVLVGLILSMLMTPMYHASTTVRVDPQNAEILEGQELVDPYIGSNEIFRYMETLKAVIVSRSMALRVADQLKLAESEALLGDMIAEGPPAGTSEEAWLEERRQAAASYLMGGVEVAVPLNTRIIEIGFSADDPQLAANAANAYVDNFLTDNVSRSMEANAYARDFLERKLSRPAMSCETLNCGRSNMPAPIVSSGNCRRILTGRTSALRPR